LLKFAGNVKNVKTELIFLVCRMVKTNKEIRDRFFSIFFVKIAYILYHQSTKDDKCNSVRKWYKKSKTIEIFGPSRTVFEFQPFEFYILAVRDVITYL
jgi:hypothetical protein